MAEGSIIKRQGKRGVSYLLKYDAGRDPVTGKRIQRYETVRGTKAKAQEKLRALLKAADDGLAIEPTKITVAEYLRRWLADDAKPRVAAKTYERYADIVEHHLIPALGAVALSKLAPVAIQGYYAKAASEGHRKRAGGLSAQTIRHHHRVLSRALSRAVRLQLLARNPAAAVDPPKAGRKEMAVLGQADASKLLSAIEGTQLHMPVLLSLTCGLRRGEALGLRWQDVDFVNGRISVAQVTEQTKEGGIKFKVPKTARSRRTIALPQFTLDALRRHQIAQKTERLRLGPLWQDHGLVCTRPDGRPMIPHAISDAFRDCVRRLKLGIRYHDTRHSFASFLLAANVHPKVASELLGHASVGITLDTYSHLVPGLREDAAAKLDEVFRVGER